ncbi:MAG: SIS domain-containing protein [Chloroflexi bacterium]|nr:SIS domain-containing protein [Chloroflexota bacterium]
MSLHDEIVEQPSRARDLVTHGRTTVEAIARSIADRPIDLVLIAARGSSDHAAIYAQYLFGTLQRLPVALAAPALTSVYGVETSLERALVIGISQSGRSPDVVGVLESARRQGAPTVAITNDPGSALATTAEHVIDIAAGPERATAATKTYTQSLLAVAMLVAAMEQGTGFAGTAGERWAALDALPSVMAAALAVEPQVAAVAEARAGLDRCIVLGRGFEYATAREWALKLKELAQVAADPYSAADFQHGPLALVEPGYPVLAVAPSGATLPGMTELLTRLRDQHGVDLVVVSDVPEVQALGAAALPTPPAPAEWLSPLVSTLPAQLFAYHVTRAKGQDTEQPRWISKVTLTH